MTFSARDRRALSLGAAGLVLIAATRYGVMPWVDRWLDARRRIVAARTELADLELAVRRVLGQRQRLERVYGPAVRTAPADLETARVELYRAVQQCLKANGIKPMDYQPQPPRRLREVPGVQLVPLQVRAKCAFAQLVKCLASVRAADSLVIVDRVTAVNNEKSPGQLEVTFMLATLARLAPAPRHAPMPAALPGGTVP